METARTVGIGLVLTALVGFTGLPDPDPSDLANVGTGSVTGDVVFEGAAEGFVRTDAVVYLVGDGLEGAAPVADEPVLDQRDITFVPHVVPVTVGQDLEIHNADGILHNVKTRSRENRPFNKAQMGSTVLTVSFEAPEVITVVCNIHSQMSAFIVVVPNGFVTRVGEDGTYTLDGVPAGTYELVAWHEDYGEVRTEVTVEGDAATTTVVHFAR